MPDAPARSRSPTSSTTASARASPRRASRPSDVIVAWPEIVGERLARVLAARQGRVAAPPAGADPGRAAGAGDARGAGRERLRARAAAPRAARDRAHQRPLRLALHRPARAEAGAGAARRARSRAAGPSSAADERSALAGGPRPIARGAVCGRRSSRLGAAVVGANAPGPPHEAVTARPPCHIPARSLTAGPTRPSGTRFGDVHDHAARGARPPRLGGRYGRSCRQLPGLAQNAVAGGPRGRPGPLGDVALGPADAKVTIIEYASLTCSHCAAFHEETFPELKKRYIDTGKVRFILREFPLDPLATAGFMLARCDGEHEILPVVDLLFSPAARLGLRQQAPRRAAADDAAGRFLTGKVRSPA